jgi:hypothetical protein
MGGKYGADRRPVRRERQEQWRPRLRGRAETVGYKNDWLDSPISRRPPRICSQLAIESSRALFEGGKVAEKINSTGSVRGVEADRVSPRGRLSGVAVHAGRTRRNVAGSRHPAGSGVPVRGRRGAPCRQVGPAGRVAIAKRPRRGINELLSFSQDTENPERSAQRNGR